MADPDGEERRYAVPRKRKLDPKLEHEIRVAAGRGSSRRTLAAKHGVSHQTIASILRANVASADFVAMVAD